MVRVLEGRVLVVDDGPENRHLLRIILGKLGLDVESAENGLIACRMAEHSLAVGRPFGLIMMDMQMPELDGYEATRRLRRQGWDRPIVALTAHVLPGDREKCLAAGCDEYLAKPVDRRRLLATVSAYLERPLTPTHSVRLPPRSLLDDPRIAPADRQRIIDCFLGTLADRMARIQQALLEDDREALISEVHSVAGTAGLLGFAQLSTHAAEMERQARGQSPFEALRAGAEAMLRCARTAGQADDGV
jgi:CheY-like chemotaxis protein/HPt (histidine-containing phosphotransfer) domain-containing protein